MKNHWLRLSALAVLGGLSAVVGCSTDSGDPVGTTGGAETTTSTTSPTTSVSTDSGSTDSGLTSETSTDTDFDLTTGVTTTTTGETGDMGPENGGTRPLTPEQVTSIKEGECAGGTAAAQPIPSVIEMVVDVSQSMDAVAPGEPAIGGRTRWDLALPALLEALDALPDETAVGLQLFPTTNPPQGPVGPGPGPGTGGAAGDTAAECVGADGRVPIAVLGAAGSPQRTALSDAMTQTPLFLGTPTHDAYHNALEEGLKPYTGAGDKFMLLMTDGAPTQLIGCGTLGTDQMAVGLEPIIAEVTATAATGIRTFVIGSPGSEEGPSGDMRNFLSEVAQVGGTGPEGCANTGPTYCHLDMTQSTDFTTALVDGLAAIADQVVSVCTFAAPADAAADQDQTAVILEWGDGTAAQVLHDADADCQEGWVWNAAGEIELCAATCAAVKADPGASISVSLGCDELVR